MGDGSEGGSAASDVGEPRQGGPGGRHISVGGQLEPFIPSRTSAGGHPTLERARRQPRPCRGALGGSRVRPGPDCPSTTPDDAEPSGGERWLPSWLRRGLPDIQGLEA